MNYKMDEPRVMFIEIPTMQKSRSVSPISPSLCRDKHTGFFDLLGRRFGRRSHGELYFNHNGEEDTRSSSTESCSSTSGQLRTDEINKSRADSRYKFTNHTNCDGSNCSSDSSSESIDNTTNNGSNIHRRSSSKLRRTMENLSISSRSLSCSSTLSKEQQQKTKDCKKASPPPPKRILRQPISYTYLKGMSGLPTQRVPRSSVCCHYTHR